MAQGNSFTRQLYLGTDPTVDPSIEAGAGAPVGVPNVGALYLDTTAGDLYIGVAGIPNTWTIIQSGLVDLTTGVTGVLPVANGGTNTNTLVGKSVLLSDALGTAVTEQALTDGQLLIGSTGNAPVAATLTGGGGISATGAPGAITLGSAGGGDVTGAYDNNTVTKIQNNPVSAAAPLNGEVLKWDTSLIPPQWVPSSDIDTGITQLTGDVTAGPGSGSQSATVVKLNGNPIAATAPADKQVLTWNAGAIPPEWEPGAVDLGSAVAVTGVLPVSHGGTNVSTLTGKSILLSDALGTAVTEQALTDGQLLIGSTGNAPVAATITGGGGISATGAPGAITLGSAGGGDVTGSYDANTVTAIQNYPVANTAPTAGQVLKWNTALVPPKWEPATDSASPANPLDSVQYNGAGAFAGSANFTYNGTQLYVANAANTSTIRVDNTGSTEEVNIQPNQIQITDAAGATNTITQSTIASTTTLTTTSGTNTTITATAGYINLDMAANKALQIRGSDGTSGQSLVSGGAGAAPTWTAVNLASATSVTGTLPVSNGGTNVNTLTGKSVLLSNAAGTAVTEQALTDGQLLIGSTGLSPVAATITGGGGISATGGAGSITLGSSGGGDVTGAYSANTVTKLQNRTVANTAPTAGQVLKWNAGLNQWEPATDSATPAAPLNSVQYNSASAFAGSANFTYDGTQVYLGNAANTSTLRVDNTGTTEEVNIQPNQVQITDSAGATNAFTQTGLNSSTALTLTSATNTTLTATAGYINLNMAANKALQIRGADGTAGQSLISGGAGAAPSWTAVNLASGTSVTGTLPFGNGGTGATAFTVNHVPYSDGTKFISSANHTYNGTQLYLGNAANTSTLRVDNTGTTEEVNIQPDQVQITNAAGATNAFTQSGLNSSTTLTLTSATAQTYTATAGPINLNMAAASPLQIRGAAGASGQALVSQGAAAAPIWTAISLASGSAGITGTLAFANGGTGNTAFPNQQVIYSDGTKFVSSGNMTYDGSAFLVTTTGTTVGGVQVNTSTNYAIVQSGRIRMWETGTNTYTEYTRNSLTSTNTAYTITAATALTLTATTTFINLNPTTAVQLNGAAGTAGQVFTSGGAAAPPTWTTPITVNSANNLGLTDLNGVAPTGAQLRDIPAFRCIGGFAGALFQLVAPTGAADGRQVSFLNNTGANLTIQNIGNVANRVMANFGGSTWVYSATANNWFCTGNT